MSDVLSWVCRSPVRLVTVVVACLALGVTGAAFVGRSGASVSTTAATASPAPSVTAPSPEPYVRAALTFARAWSGSDAGQGRDDWLNSVTALSTDELAAGLAMTDSASLPQSAPAGHPSVRFVSDDSALVIVPLRSGDEVAVTVVRSGGNRWLVSDIQPNVGDHGETG